MKKAVLLSTLALILPVVTFAQGDGTGDIFATVQDLIEKSIGVIFALALLFFLWGVGLYITRTDETKRKEARQIMLWGIIGLAVMSSVWGLVNLITGYFSFESETVEVPIVPDF